MPLLRARLRPARILTACPARPAGHTAGMDPERADYGDPAMPRSRASNLLIIVLVWIGLGALAVEVWIGLNEFVLSACHKPPP